MGSIAGEVASSVESQQQFASVLELLDLDCKNLDNP